MDDMLGPYVEENRFPMSPFGLSDTFEWIDCSDSFHPQSRRPSLHPNHFSEHRRSRIKSRNEEHSHSSSS